MTDMSPWEYYIFRRFFLKALYLRIMSHHIQWTSELSLKCLKKGHKATLLQKSATRTQLVSQKKFMHRIIFPKFSFHLKWGEMSSTSSSEYLSPRGDPELESNKVKDKLQGEKVQHILHKLCKNFFNTCFSIYTTDQGRLESNFKSNNPISMCRVVDSALSSTLCFLVGNVHSGT